MCAKLIVEIKAKAVKPWKGYLRLTKTIKFLNALAWKEEQHLKAEAISFCKAGFMFQS